MNNSTNFIGQHIFSQLTSLCKRAELSVVFKTSNADHYYKRLKGFEHFISMLFCAVSGSTSLREIVGGLSVAQGKLRHLDIDYVPPKSTLSDANKQRSSFVFKNIYEHLYKKYKPNLSDSRLPKTVLDKLYLMDSTVFGLFKAILKTSGRNAIDSKRKGGIKKNTIIEGASLMPCFVKFNAAADNDQKIYEHLNLPCGSYIVFDKGYNNYLQFAEFTRKEIFFVTRQKENALYQTQFECWHDDSVPQSILKEETILQQYKDENGMLKTLRLRRIAWLDEKRNITYELITNNFLLDAITIVNLYRYRWQIELFFKKLKQNFPLNYFVGDNQNAIEIQIWCALIALLLLSIQHIQHKTKMAFSVFVTIVRTHLFSYISIAQIIQHYKPNPPPVKVPNLFDILPAF